MKRLFLIVCLSSSFLVSVVNQGTWVEAADPFPVKPISIIIPMEAGASADIIFRPLMEKASALLGKPILVVNKPGAGHTIGYREVYRAKPDGYTIGMASGSIITAKLQGLLPYDHRDFTHLCTVTYVYPMIVASMKTQRPFKTIEEAFSFAKSHPGEVSMATSQLGGPLWNAAMVIQEGTGLQFNIVPQEGSAGLIVIQAAGGHTDLGIVFPAAAKGQIEAGNIRFLAAAGPERYPGRYNTIPTIKEIGYDVSYYSFSSIIGPPKMPKEIKDKLIKAFETAKRDPEFEKHVLAQNSLPWHLPPDLFINSCDKERETFRRVLAKAGLLKEK